MMESSHRLILLPFPKIQCIFSLNKFQYLTQSSQILVPFWVLWTMSKHLQTLPLMYFFLRSYDAQFLVSTSILQRIFPPTARLMIWTSWIPRTPLSMWPFTIFQLSNRTFFPLFSAYHRNVLTILLIWLRTKDGASRTKQRYNGIEDRTELINMILPIRLSLFSTHFWTFFENSSITVFQYPFFVSYMFYYDTYYTIVFTQKNNNKYDVLISFMTSWLKGAELIYPKVDK